jgi:type IV pilus biogenesis protein CpaD/CtpE
VAPIKQLVIVAALLGLAACTQNTPSAVAAAPACAASLSPDSRQIYDAVRAEPQQGTLRNRVADQTRSMVMLGDLRRSNARPAAIAAAQCLRQTHGITP